jgi:hypothetical protein
MQTSTGTRRLDQNARICPVPGLPRLDREGAPTTAARRALSRTCSITQRDVHRPDARCSEGGVSMSEKIREWQRQGGVPEIPSKALLTCLHRLTGSRLERGQPAWRSGAPNARGRVGVAVAQGDQPVPVCHSAGGCRVAAAGQAGAETLAVAVAASGSGGDLPGACCGRVFAKDRPRVGACPSTVYREVAANGGPGRYRACSADRRALRMLHRRKPAKLAQCPRLREVAGSKLELRWPYGADRGLAEGELSR